MKYYNELETPKILEPFELICLDTYKTTNLYKMPFLQQEVILWSIHTSYMR